MIGLSSIHFSVLEGCCIQERLLQAGQEQDSLEDSDDIEMLASC